MFKKLNSPLPQPLPKECQKAAKIFSSFVDSGNNGLDGVVPRQILERARGFAIFSVVKAGLVFSARAGSGVVIARLDDGTWSAPSAIGTAGLGVGGQLGAEVTDFLIILNSRSALKSFMTAGSLTLGGNLSIAVGPLGRNGEAIGSLSSGGSLAAMYSYSKTRGLFGGVSIEGSVIVERQDANSLAYADENVTVKRLLSGAVAPPDWASGLIKTLEVCTGLPRGHKWINDTPTTPGQGAGGDDYFGGSAPPSQPSTPGYAFGGEGSGGTAGRRSPGLGLLSKKRKNSIPGFPPASWGSPKISGSYFNELESRRDADADANQAGHKKTASFASGDENLAGRVRRMSLGLRSASSNALANVKPPVPAAAAPASSADAHPAPGSFGTHFDSDFVSDRELSRHPHLTQVASAGENNGPTPRDADNLIDLGPNPGAYQSPLDFDPLGSSTERPSSGTRTSTNPYFQQHRPSASFGSASGRANSSYGMGSTEPVSMPSASPFNDLDTYLSSNRDHHNQTSTFMDDDDSLYTPPTRPRPLSGADQANGRGTPGSPGPQLSLRPELRNPLPSYAVGRAIALFDFGVAQPGDLSFKAGQVITIIEKTGTTNAWWKGEIEGRQGIFPANFVEIA